MDYNARYYSPRLGRFVSPDSLIPDPANSQSSNRYAYAYNNPVRYSDPSGRCVVCIVAIALVVVAAVEFLANPDIANGMTPAEDAVYTGPRDNPDYGREICSWCVDAQHGDYGAAAVNLAIDVAPIGKLLPMPNGAGRSVLGAVEGAGESLPGGSVTRHTEMLDANLGRTTNLSGEFFPLDPRKSCYECAVDAGLDPARAGQRRAILNFPNVPHAVLGTETPGGGFTVTDNHSMSRYFGNDIPLEEYSQNVQGRGFNPSVEIWPDDVLGHMLERHTRGR